jgi:hypothetical protein
MGCYFAYWNLLFANVFSDNLKLSENSDYNCLSGKESVNSLPDKLKSMEYSIDHNSPFNFVHFFYRKIISGITAGAVKG